LWQALTAEQQQDRDIMETAKKIIEPQDHTASVIIADWTRRYKARLVSHHGYAEESVRAMEVSDFYGKATGFENDPEGAADICEKSVRAKEGEEYWRLKGRGS
jgi:hypothetical protein